MPNVKKSMKAIRKAMQQDQDYAWSWHCNIAVAAQDQGLTHAAANRAAATLMYNAFRINMEEDDRYLDTQEDVKSECRDNEACCGTGEQLCGDKAGTAFVSGLGSVQGINLTAQRPVFHVRLDGVGHSKKKLNKLKARFTEADPDSVYVVTGTNVTVERLLG